MLNIGVENIKFALKAIPSKSGVYKMMDGKKVLYVGKAKNLYKRVYSYTKYEKLPDRLKRMITQVQSVEYIVTKNEIEALLLECNLIKQCRPPFNILLKDDKSFAYLRITNNHPFSRLVKYRGIKTDDSFFFGPFPMTSTTDEMLVNLQKIFQLRNCSDEEFARRKRPCLQYHIKRCTAPCVQYVSQDKYQEQVDQAKAFLKGQIEDVQNALSKKIQIFSQDMAYEQAEIYYNKLKQVQRFLLHQRFDFYDVDEADILVLYYQNNRYYLTQLIVRFKRNLGSYTYALEHAQDADHKIVLQSFIEQFYIAHQPPKKIMVNDISDEIKKMERVLCERYRYLVEIDLIKNNYLISFVLKQSKVNFDNSNIEEVFTILEKKFSREIDRIEVYDNSHFQGSYPYGVMIVVKRDGFNKNEYKKFKVSIVHSQDDYAMMQEVLNRRFQHIEWEKPDLVMIDGGKGQLGIARKIISKDIEVISIAKGQDDPDIIYCSDFSEMPVIKGSILYSFFQAIRDEAHRFAISTYKKAHLKSITMSKLDMIKGVGKKRKKDLMMHFDSIKDLEQASVDDLQLIKGINKKTAEIIWKFFHGN